MPAYNVKICFPCQAKGYAHGDLTYCIQEELKHGSVIGNIAKDLGLELGRLASRKARVDMEGSEKQYVGINMRNGDLFVAARIDREEHCGEKPNCVLKFDLLLENPLELHRLSLQVQDINDNEPIFPKDIIKLEIRESTEKGAKYRINAAHDADIGQNTVQSYILQQNPNFVLNIQTSPGRKYGELVLDKKLDREEQHELKIILTAVDGGSPRRSGTVVIHVTVLDANDNAPVFTEAVYTARLPENSPLKTAVITVSAADADDGINGEVTYEFSRLSDQSQTLFSLDSKTGEIIVTGNIDYEERSKYEVFIEAKDGYGLSSEAKVIIDISDVNDNSPQILYPAPEGSSFMTELVPKAAHGGSLVSKVIAVDADSGQNAWLSYHIVKATDPGLFTIGLHSGEIRTQRDISESDSMKQNLIVAVKDNGQPSLSATCAMYLLISDNLAEVPELKDISYDEKNSKLTSYLIIALVSVSTFFLTFIIIILGVRFCRRRKPRLLFDGAVAIPGAYLPPNYADVDGTGTLRSAYNYDAYLTTGSRTSDFKFVSSYNDNTLPADQTLKKSPTEFADMFGDSDASPEVGINSVTCLKVLARRYLFLCSGAKCSWRSDLFRPGGAETRICNRKCCQRSEPGAGRIIKS
uniref:Cadherin domain-containing protein n=1 Tax=Fundulus heteroclitus TaxID=8078 RepID=A0A3Q2QWS5_FUNHE